MAVRRILFIHDNFPGQFGGLGAWLAARGWEVGFATAARGFEAPAGWRILPYAPRSVHRLEGHAPKDEMEVYPMELQLP